MFSFHLHAHPDIASPICLQAFRNLLGIFKYQWKSLKSLASTPGPITHGNSGKRNRHNGSAAKTVAADVVAFLTKIGNDFGELYATRFIRERSSFGLRKEEEDLI